MPKFGVTSTKRLETCVPELQEICIEAIKMMDFSVTCGHRGKKEQDQAVLAGMSKAPYPKSKHNKFLSVAVDLAPYPIDWKNLKRFYLLAGIVLAIAHIKGINLRWGGDWDRDYDLDDQKFIDLPHFEVIK